jgi:hypothetical protein
VKPSLPSRLIALLVLLASALAGCQESGDAPSTPIEPAKIAPKVKQAANEGEVIDESW